MNQAPPFQQQLASTVAAFERRFGRRPTVAAAAPGRVNLIGEHTDYNDGFVMPMALDRQTLIVADPSPRGGARATVISTDMDGEAVFDVGPDIQRGEPRWSNYVRGAVAGCAGKGLSPGGFDAAVSSTVPVGSGLSSSAAIEVATATLVELLSGKRLDPVDKALLMQEAEHTFAGVPCGIMDQFISVMGKAGHALLIDCRSHATEMVPLDDPSIAVLVINSNVSHELSGGEYRARREQCEAAAKALGVKALRDATMPHLEKARGDLDEVTYRRARHVITECGRTLAAAQAMRHGDWKAVGGLMAESHASLRDDFEVSTPELDKLVELAASHTGSGAVLGSRMTGAGFGGCTVSLVRADDAHRVSDQIAAAYEQATGAAATCFVTTAGDGARAVAI